MAVVNESRRSNGRLFANDRRWSLFSGGGYAAYDVPTIANHNPLYSALSEKARKLRGADVVAGIFVGDADTRSISSDNPGFGGVTTKAIVETFLSEFDHIDFVMLLTVAQEPTSFASLGSNRRDIAI